MKKDRLTNIAGHPLDDRGRLISQPIDLDRPGDHGADPLGDGTFRMVPSGDIVDFAERNRRLGERLGPMHGAGPLIHINGSSKRTLIDDISKALVALAKAREPLAQTAPNMRDFYPLAFADNKFRSAQQAHCKRVRDLDQIIREIEALGEAIQDQKDNRP